MVADSSVVPAALLACLNPPLIPLLYASMPCYLSALPPVYALECLQQCIDEVYNSRLAFTQ
jgi:hypothetical protein